jgi:hypothetical protein
MAADVTPLSPPYCGVDQQACVIQAARHPFLQCRYWLQVILVVG